MSDDARTAAIRTGLTVLTEIATNEEVAVPYRIAAATTILDNQYLFSALETPEVETEEA
jgi:hypothetical protein